jgi:predicted  nucleic acid-binding Zn-ribbon protein
MTSDLQNLIELQQIDSQIAGLRAEVASLPSMLRRSRPNSPPLRQSRDDAFGRQGRRRRRRKHESDIQDQQRRSQVRDQSLNVKTNQEYKALMEEIKFAEQKIAA